MQEFEHCTCAPGILEVQIAVADLVRKRRPQPAPLHVVLSVLCQFGTDDAFHLGGIRVAVQPLSQRRVLTQPQ